MSEIGMAIARMREIVAECQTSQEYLRQIEGEVDGRVHSLEAVWQGESVAAYRERWGRARGEMDEAVWTIDQIRELLDQAINELIIADRKGASISQGG